MTGAVASGLQMGQFQIRPAQAGDARAMAERVRRRANGELWDSIMMGLPL